MIDKRKQGKKNRASGARFENLVRKDLEKKGWFVSKFQNTVDIEQRKMIPAKRKYNPFSRAFAVGTGFPDFLIWRRLTGKEIKKEKPYNVIGIECKTNGYLDKTEKAKCEFFLAKGIFNRILIAKKTKVGRKIVPEYKDFKEQYKLSVSINRSLKQASKGQLRRIA